MEVPDPKFSHGELITATAERYGPGCPEESKKGHISEMRFVVAEYDKVINEWEYEVMFKDGSYGTFSEESLMKGIQYEHRCEHERSNAQTA